MNVYQKLNQARIELQSLPLKKSGRNNHAGYNYFELGDFLPQVNALFARLGLCAIFNATRDSATLAVFDADKPDSMAVVFECPFGSASLKGCHDVQNVGASLTYSRRYLYMQALEMVEHDALDAVTGMEPVAPAVSQQELAKALQELRGAAMQGTAALKACFAELKKTEAGKAVWADHSASLKDAANKADNEGN